MTPGNLWGLDHDGKPIYMGRDDDGYPATVVMALDEPGLVVTVYGE